MLLAQTGDTAGQFAPWLTLVNLGVSGLFLWLFSTGRLHSDKDYQRIVSRNDELEQELRQRNENDRQSLIPALVRATDVLAAFLERRTGDTPPPPNKPIRR